MKPDFKCVKSVQKLCQSESQTCQTCRRPESKGSADEDEEEEDEFDPEIFDDDDFYQQLLKANHSVSCCIPFSQLLLFEAALGVPAYLTS